MVQLLLDFGASPDAAVWQRAYCISDADSVRELLEVAPAGRHGRGLCRTVKAALPLRQLRPSACSSPLSCGGF